MKVSTMPTNIIALSARNNSEWDNCDFALLFLNDKYIHNLNLRSECLNLVKDCPDFAGLRFWEAPDGWYVFSENTTDLEEVLQKREWCYVDFDDCDKDGLTAPDQRIDGEFMRIHSDGSFCFVGHGKHTGEEFWTSDVPTKTIIKNFQKLLATT